MVKVTDITDNTKRSLENSLKIEDLVNSIFHASVSFDYSKNIVYITTEFMTNPLIAAIDVNNHSLKLYLESYFKNAMKFAEEYEKEFLTGSDKKEFEIITDYYLYT